MIDQFGTPIPEAQLVGEGDVWVLTAGGLVPGRWHKPSLEADHHLHRRRRQPDRASRPVAPGSPCPMPGGATACG